MASLNKQALLRYRIIDELIRLKNYPSMQDIIKLCEYRIGKTFSKETLQKDIEAMKNDLSLGFEAPIKYNRTYRGYEYTDENFSIITNNLNYLEKQQIKVASEILLQFKESKLGESAITLLQKINIAFQNPDILDENKKIIEFENSNFNNYELLQQLYLSIQHKSKLSLIYFVVESNKFYEITVYPLFLKEYRNNWFLIVELNDDILSLNLNYIFDLIDLETDGKYIASIDIHEFLKYSIGVVVESEYLEKIEIKFKAEIANEIKNNPFHQSQKIIKEYKNGDLLVKYKMYITDELISEILKFGTKAFVTKNELLQELMLKELEDSWVEYRRALKYI